MPIIPTPTLKSEIVKKNARWEPADNWLSTLPEAQRKNMLGVQVDHADLAAVMQRAALAAAIAPPAAPPFVDWRNHNGSAYISPVKNQGGCGSCVSFCTVALVEAMAAIERGTRYLDLSEADLHFCSSHGQNCGGWWPTAALDDVRTRGVVDESLFPYMSGFNGGHPQCLNIPNRAAKATKIGAFTALVRTAERKAWLAATGPLSAVFHVYDDFFSYRSGVYSHTTGGEAGYHCVEIVGYSDGEGCWICKNSWGPAWGEQGFFKIAYGQCGIDDASTDRDSSGTVLQFPMWGARNVALPAPPAPKIHAIEAAINSDGRLEVFTVSNADNSLWNTWQAAPHSGPWAAMSQLGGQVKSIDSALNSDGRLEVFGIGMHDALFNMWQTHPHAGPWSGWNSLGGKVKQIAAARNSDGRLEVFGIGTDDALWNIWQTHPHAGPWSGWNSLGGKVKQIAATINSDGRLEVFGIGTDDALWNIWQTHAHAGPWSGWNSLGGKVKQIAAACNSDGRLEVFGIGTDDAAYNIWQAAPHSGPWSGWNSLGGKVSQISVALNSDGRLELFGIGADQGLWHCWQNHPHAGPWSGWSSLGGKVKRIAASRNSDGRLEVFGIGMDDGLWNIWQTHPHAGPWSGWNKIA